MSEWAAAQGKRGPACGWVLAYVEVLHGAYHYSLRRVFFGMEIEAGLALLEARAARLNPKEATGYIDRAIMRARHQAQRDALKTHTIIR